MRDKCFSHRPQSLGQYHILTNSGDRTRWLLRGKKLYKLGSPENWAPVQSLTLFCWGITSFLWTSLVLCHKFPFFYNVMKRKISPLTARRFPSPTAWDSFFKAWVMGLTLLIFTWGLFGTGHDLSPDSACPEICRNLSTL